MKINDFSEDIVITAKETSEKIFEEIESILMESKYSDICERVKSISITWALNLVLDTVAFGMMKDKMFAIRSDYQKFEDSENKDINFYLNDIKKDCEKIIEIVKTKEGKIEHF